MGSVFSMILSTLAILMLGAKSTFSGFGGDGGTLGIIGLSALLAVFGIASGASRTKDAFTGTAIGLSIVVLVLSVVILSVLLGALANR